MSVYLFVPSVLGLLLTYSALAVATFGRFHSTLMGTLARDVLFARLYFLSANCVMHAFR